MSLRLTFIRPRAPNLRGIFRSAIALQTVSWRFRFPLTGLALLTFTACVSPPKNQNAKLKIETPDHWKSTAPSGSFQSQNWVSDFKDTQLVKIIEEALAYNYDLKVAESRLAASVAGSVSAQSGLWPSLNLGGNSNKSRRSVASGIQQTPTSQTYGLNARLNWEVDLWGKVRNGFRGDMADIEAAEFDYDAARLSIMGRVAKAWYSAIEATQQYELSLKILEAFERSAEIVEENFRRGIARALDVRLIRANVAANAVSVEQRMRARDAAIRNLETLVGRYPANEIAVATELPSLNGGVPSGLPSELLLRRPDVLAAERRLAAAEQRKFESSKARLPSFSLTLNRGTSSAELEDILDITDRRVWSQIFNVSQPIFQGKRLQANYQQSKAQYEQSLANYSTTVLTAFREVENALNAQSSYERDLELQRVATEESIEAEKLAWEEYERGLVDITTALDSVRRSITTQRSLIQVSNQQLQSRIDLYLSLGGGFGLDTSDN